MLTLGSDPELIEDLRCQKPELAPLLRAKIPATCIYCRRSCVTEQPATRVICLWCAAGPDAHHPLNEALADARKRATERQRARTGETRAPQT